MTVWHNVKTGALHVKISPDLIREAVKSGELPAFPVGKGREFRLREADIDAWMESRSWEPRSA